MLMQENTNKRHTHELKALYKYTIIFCVTEAYIGYYIYTFISLNQVLLLNMKLERSLGDPNEHSQHLSFRQQRKVIFKSFQIHSF